MRIKRNKKPVQGFKGSRFKVKTKKYKRSEIKELKEGMYREIRAAILHTFETNLFYEICPECGTRLKKQDNVFKCNNHGEVKPLYNIVLTGIVDDGTDNIRIVLFGKQAEKIIGMKKEDIRNLFETEKNISSILKKIELCKDFLFSGKVRKNDFFGKLEFIVNDIKNVDIKEEIEMLLN